jgi:hypothetical protein
MSIRHAEVTDQLSTSIFTAQWTIQGGPAQLYSMPVTTNAAITVKPPVGFAPGRRFTVQIRNLSAGAMGALTWDPIFKVSGWTNPAPGFNRSIDFYYDGNFYYQVGPTVDVPN